MKTGNPTKTASSPMNGCFQMNFSALAANSHSNLRMDSVMLITIFLLLIYNKRQMSRFCKRRVSFPNFGGWAYSKRQMSAPF